MGSADLKMDGYANSIEESSKPSHPSRPRRLRQLQPTPECQTTEPAWKWPAMTKRKPSRWREELRAGQPAMTTGRYCAMMCRCSRRLPSRKLGYDNTPAHEYYGFGAAGPAG